MNAPHPVDVAVGARVKAARVAKGVSQSALGAELGLTFQQIQKYERGANRISASKIVEIAAVLGVDPADFFTGMGDTTEPAVDYEVFSSPGVTELAVAYRKLRPREQRAVLRLAQELGAA